MNNHLIKASLLTITATIMVLQGNSVDAGGAHKHTAEVKNKNRIIKNHGNISIECRADTNEGKLIYTYRYDDYVKTKSIEAPIKGKKIIGFDCFQKQTYIIIEDKAIFFDGYGLVYLGSQERYIRISNIAIDFKKDQGATAVKAFISENTAVVLLSDNTLLITDTGYIPNKFRDIDVLFFYEYIIVWRKNGGKVLYIAKQNSNYMITVDKKSKVTIDLFKTKYELELDILRSILDKSFKKAELNDKQSEGTSQ